MHTNCAVMKDITMTSLRWKLTRWKSRGDTHTTRIITKLTANELPVYVRIDKHSTQCCLSSPVSEGFPSFLVFAGATLAGVERSDWENRIKMCIRTVTTAKPDTVNAIPLREDKREDHWRNFSAPKIRRHAQEVTTWSRQSVK
jgi:hypothetical protein